MKPIHQVSGAEDTDGSDNRPWGRYTHLRLRTESLAVNPSDTQLDVEQIISLLQNRVSTVKPAGKGYFKSPWDWASSLVMGQQQECCYKPADRSHGQGRCWKTEVGKVFITLLGIFNPLPLAFCNVCLWDTHNLWSLRLSTSSNTSVFHLGCSRRQQDTACCLGTSPQFCLFPSLTQEH